MLFNKSNIGEIGNDDILLNYQRKQTSKKEITANMQTEIIAEIISDKIMARISKSLKIKENEKLKNNE